MTLIFAAASLFPYDSKIDSVMDHEHLVIAYCLTWFVHLCYLCYVGSKWHLAGKDLLRNDKFHVGSE
jgi:hypothetical protein